MLPFRFGIPELLIILAIVVLLFGVGRISKISGELGSAIRRFREGLKGENKPNQVVKRTRIKINRYLVRCA